MSFGPDDDFLAHDALGPDVLEHEGGPRRRGLLAFGALVLVGAAVVPTVVHRHEQSVRKHNRAAYEQLLNLSAAGEASVEQAVSQARDVNNYAEPLLNSAMTTSATRQTLYLQVKSAQNVGRTTIDAQLQALSDDPTTSHSHRLQAARQATIDYLSAWSAMFGPASGTQTTDNLDARRSAALSALQAAAPDATLAEAAGVVLGSTQPVQ